MSCAAHIGISSVMLSRVLHGHAAVSADMDLRLAGEADKARKKIKRVRVPDIPVSSAISKTSYSQTHHVIGCHVYLQFGRSRYEMATLECCNV